MIGVFALYSVHLNLGGNENPSVAVKTSNVIGSAFTSSSLQSSSAPSGGYKNGTYIGSVADAFYGNIQVQTTISNGKISNITFLQFPNDNRTSQYVNSQADPILAQEAIQTQSAQVDIVSGASASSQAFQASLADALSQAK